jgi:WD40 repeat protein
MGGFYGSVQIRGVDRDAVKAVVEKLARKRKLRFLLGPQLGDWIGVYPECGGQDSKVGREFARELGAELIQLIVHDDDVFTYDYYHNGKLVDQYNSCPDYFGETVSRRERLKLVGRPECFSHLLADASAVAGLKQCLAEADAEPFAYAVLQKFSDALGIRNAVASYEYLQDGETDQTEGWDQFIHIPDLSDEKASEQRAGAQLEKTKQGLMRNGLLLKELAAEPGIHSPWPWFSQAPDSSSFLVAWSGHANPGEKLCQLQKCGPPWSDSPSATPLSIDGHIYGMALSPSSRYLAVAHAAGDWKATLWDLVENRRVGETPQVRAVSWVGFTPDSRAMISISSDGEQGKVVIEPVDGSSAKTLLLKHASRAAVHPKGENLVVADIRNRLSVVNIATWQVERTIFGGGRRTASAAEEMMTAHVKAATASIAYDKVEQKIREQQDRLISSLDPRHLPPGVASIEAFKEQIQQQMAKQLEAMRQHNAQLGTPEWQAEQAAGALPVLSLLFDDSGERLFIGSSRGVHVYEWNEMAMAGDRWPHPVHVVELQPRLVTTRKVSINLDPSVLSLAYDANRNWLVFGSQDGCVHVLDLPSRCSGVLVEPPGAWPIHYLALSNDLSALGLKYQPDPMSTSIIRPGPMLQFWNYPALCDKAVQSW